MKTCAILNLRRTPVISRGGLLGLLLALALLSIGLPLSGQSDSTAKQVKPQKDRRTLLGVGWGIDPLEPTRRQLDLLFGDVEPGNRYTLTTSARYGRYAPDKLVGAGRAARDGFAPDVRKDFWSLYMGFQGRAPVLPEGWRLYTRVSAGGSAYMGQQFRDAPPGGHPSEIQLKVPMRLAPGAEAALGTAWLRISGEFGLRAELRLGYEHLPRSDRQGLNSMMVFGFAFPL